MNRIGLFFGSFNPIHLGHIAVAEYFAKNNNLESVWLVISPQSPFKKKSALMENHHRLAMVELAIEDKSKLKACAEEFNLPTPNYTINTLNHLKKKFPENQFILILGEDNMANFDQWKDHRQIIDQFQIFVYPRTHSEKISASLSNHTNIIYFSASLLNVSASEIRDAVKNKKSLTNLLPSKINDYIQKFNLYN